METEKNIQSSTPYSELNTTENSSKLYSTQMFNSEKAKNNFEKVKQNSEAEISNEPSLMHQPKITVFWRYALPSLILFNIVMFIWSNTSTGATVSAFLSILGFHTNPEPVKKFTLTDSVSDMWKAGVYPLSLLIVIFSGVWPYIKLILMLIVWTVKESKLSFAQRERILIVLDTMGKWSMIDSYIMVIMIVAFRFQIAGTSGKVTAGFDIIVDPNWGLISFILGTLLSLVITHILIHYHRQSNKKKIDYTQEVKPLCFNSQFKKYVVLFCLIASVTLLVFGSIVDSFSFTFEGAAGWILGKKNSESYSMLSLGYSIPEKSFSPNSMGVRFIQIMFFLMAFVLPVIFIIIMIVLWMVPLKLKVQETLFTLVEIMHAWSTVDVFIVSIVTSLLQIRQFAQFIVGSNCDQINEWLKLMDDFKIIDLGGDTKCFDVVTTLKMGCTVTLISAVLYFFMGTFTLRKIQKQLNKRQADQKSQTQEQFTEIILSQYNENQKENKTDIQISNQQNNNKDKQFQDGIQISMQQQKQ